MHLELYSLISDEMIAYRILFDFSVGGNSDGRSGRHLVRCIQRKLPEETWHTDKNSCAERLISNMI